MNPELWSIHYIDGDYLHGDTLTHGGDIWCLYAEAKDEAERIAKQDGVTITLLSNSQCDIIDIWVKGKHID